MSIKFKLALPILVGMAIIILLIQFVWEPLQLDKAKTTYEKHTKELLVLAETGIIQHLLKRDLGPLFSVMEKLESNYSQRWFNITLFDNNNKRIYPIFREPGKAKAQDKSLIHIVHPLKVQNTKLGHLMIDADWGVERVTVIENLNNIRDMIIWLFALVLMITTLSQFKIIYRPLKKITNAANKIKDGDFNSELPKHNNDEIGELTEAFSAMLIELKFQKDALNQHAIVSAADKNGVIIYVNDKFLDVSGYDREELIGKTHRVVKSNTHTQEFYEDMWGTITNGKVWHGDVCNLTKTGEEYWVNSTIIPFLNDQGVPERYMSIRTDITQQKNAEEQLRYMANHDSLTGLPTRRLGKEKLSSALAQARRDKKMVAVLFIDLDGFKAVNDSLGHATGDLLLMSVSERLTNSLREVDTIVRVGGDEFIAILSEIDKREDAAMLAQKLIDTLALPFALDAKTASIGASIGIALYPDDEEEPEALIVCADKMMYAVKEKGKNNFAFYDDM